MEKGEAGEFSPEDAIRMVFRDEKMRRLGKALWLRAGELMGFAIEDAQRARQASPPTTVELAEILRAMPPTGACNHRAFAFVVREGGALGIRCANCSSEGVVRPAVTS